MTLRTDGVLVLQHIACEPPALFEDILHERGVPLTRVEVDEGEPIPDGRAFAAVIAMGGPMGANDGETLPWLARERAVIEQVVRSDVPFWGVCLGAQLLASALGARVRRGPRAEVGLGRVTTTAAAAADPVFRDAPEEFVTLQWHSDTFDLPAGSTLLASSAAYEHQAFAFRRAYGLQFHLEVTPDLVAQWAAVPAYAASLEEVSGPGAVPRLVSDVAENAERTGKVARILFTRWLDHVAEPAANNQEMP
jgi:GMP synthase-like glutamine amidotransferase